MCPTLDSFFCSSVVVFFNKEIRSLFLIRIVCLSLWNDITGEYDNPFFNQTAFLCTLKAVSTIETNGFYKKQKVIKPTRILNSQSVKQKLGIDILTQNQGNLDRMHIIYRRRTVQMLQKATKENGVTAVHDLFRKPFCCIFTTCILHKTFHVKVYTSVDKMIHKPAMKQGIFWSFWTAIQQFG